MERLKEIIDEFGIRVLFETKQDYLYYLEKHNLNKSNYVRFSFGNSTDNKDFVNGRCEPLHYPCVLWYTLEKQDNGDLVIFRGEFIYIDKEYI